MKNKDFYKNKITDLEKRLEDIFEDLKELEKMKNNVLLDGDDLYDKLENQIIPDLHNHYQCWYEETLEYIIEKFNKNKVEDFRDYLKDIKKFFDFKFEIRYPNYYIKNTYYLKIALQGQKAIFKTAVEIAKNRNYKPIKLPEIKLPEIEFGFRSIKISITRFALIVISILFVFLTVAIIYSDELRNIFNNLVK